MESLAKSLATAHTCLSVEPHVAQRSYLSFLEFTNTTATSGTLPPCQNCSVSINIPGIGFPFGSYYHSMLYVRCYTCMVKINVHA